MSPITVQYCPMPEASNVVYFMTQAVGVPGDCLQWRGYVVRRPDFPLLHDNCCCSLRSCAARERGVALRKE